MINFDRPDCDRRTFLTTLGGGSTLALAGCTGRNGSDPGSGSNTSNDGGSGKYPTEDIELVVPFATGGGFDAYTRLTKPFWQKHFPNKPTVTVRNVVGGGGVTGAVQVYNAQPDGTTIMIWDIVQSVSQQVGRNVGYDIKKMSHIGAVTQAPNCLITMKSAGISGWDDLRENIGELGIATQGIGSGAHIGIVLLGSLTDAWSQKDLKFVHYGGTGEALAGLERGEAQVFMPLTATSGLQVIGALEAEMTLLFSEPVDQESIYSGVPKQFSSELDVENMDQFADLTVMRRFFTGPPDVPDQILKTQRETFSAMVNDEKLRKEAQRKERPIVNPGSAEQVSDTLNKAFETFGSQPLKGVLKDAFKS